MSVLRRIEDLGSL